MCLGLPPDFPPHPVQFCPWAFDESQPYRIDVGSYLPPPSTGSRAPQETLLHRFVCDNYLDYFVDVGVPNDFVIKHIDAFLRCGDIRADYAVLECRTCKLRRNVPLSCRSRGWCPSCMVRRQEARARFLEECIIGDTAVRHVALTLPPPLRMFAAYDPALVTEILQVYILANFRRLKWCAKRELGLASVDDVEPACLTTVQRWSTKLDQNLHFHSLFTDGVYHQPSPDAPIEFVNLPRPSDSDIDAVAWEICRRTRDILVRRGVWEDTPEEAHDIVVSDASGRPRVLKTVAGILTLDPDRPQKCRFFGTVSQSDSDEPLRIGGACAFNLFARDRIEKGDRKNLRRVLRYMLSPPFTDAQLRSDGDGGLIFDLKRELSDGTTSKHFPNNGFMRKLVQLVPRPRANLIRLHGAWASASALREQVVPQPEKPESSSISATDTPEDHHAWSRMQSRIFPNDIRRCRACGGRMKLVLLRVGRFTYRRKSGDPPDESQIPEAPEEHIAA